MNCSSLLSISIVALFLLPAGVHSQDTAKPMPGDGTTFLLRTADGSVKDKDDMDAIYKAAQTLDLPHATALLEEMKVRLGGRTIASQSEEFVLGAVFARVEDCSEETAERYLKIIPPQAIGSFGLESYMGIADRLGGIGNLFNSYYRAETVFAKQQLLEVVRSAFSGLKVRGVEGDKYVADVERWYWANRSRLRVDKEYPSMNGP